MFNKTHFTVFNTVNNIMFFSVVQMGEEYYDTKDYTKALK